MRVVRAFALDAQRHLSLFGRYPSLLAVPDKWQSWILGGRLAGARIVRQWRPHAIMSTYPIASAHVIGAWLSRKFGLPWLADLRDPMAQDEYPTDLRVRRAYLAIERTIFSKADRVTVTTPGTAALYAERYPDYPRERLITIPNGFDPAAFPSGAPTAPETAAADGRKLQLLHSGLLYPKERNPAAFFAALTELRAEGRIHPQDVTFDFRGNGHDARYRPEVERLGLSDLVKLLPPVTHAEALAEIGAADACMIFQSSSCNQQIPAKIYEYLYSRKPILALTDPIGDTGQLLASLQVPWVTPLDEKDLIKKSLVAFLAQLRNRSLALPAMDEVLRYSRQSLTRELATTLDEMTVARAA